MLHTTKTMTCMPNILFPKLSSLLPSQLKPKKSTCDSDSESSQHWGTAHTTNHLMIHQLMVNLVLTKWSNHMGNLQKNTTRHATTKKKRNTSLPEKNGYVCSKHDMFVVFVAFPLTFLAPNNRCHLMISKSLKHKYILLYRIDLHQQH